MEARSAAMWPDTDNMRIRLVTALGNIFMGTYISHDPAILLYRGDDGVEVMRPWHVISAVYVVGKEESK